MQAQDLTPPATYTPWTKGVYEVAPGLRPFGTDFGNGELDGRLFQFDNKFEAYRGNKLRCLAERETKYRPRHELSPEVEAAVVELIVGRLLTDWPQLFCLERDRLGCALTGESVALDLDSIALQIPEDLAIVRTSGSGDWIAYLNLCSPSHWAAEEKIGKSFFETHVPVPGFERVNAVAPAMVDSMIRRGPFVRFVWGLESDTRLNHHPEPPPGEDPGSWYGRQFEHGWFVRTERQVIWGLPFVNAALFVIRVGFVRAEDVRRSPELWSSLISAVESMSAEARRYKGVEEWGVVSPMALP